MIVPLFCILALAADLTVTETMSTTADESRHDSKPVTLLLKDNRLRAETTVGDVTRGVIYDLSSSKVILLDSGKKEATMRDLREFVAAAERTIPARKVNGSMTPTLQHKDILGRTCDEYSYEVTVPVTSHNGMVLHTTGTACIQKDAAGIDAYLQFAKRANEQGLILGEGSDNRIILSLDRARTELYRRIAEIGFPYDIEMNFSFEGGGPVGALLNGKSFSRRLRVTSFSAAPIPDEQFAIPAGWRVQKK
jgi:hypothetical protein